MFFFLCFCEVFSIKRLFPILLIVALCLAAFFIPVSADTIYNTENDAFLQPVPEGSYVLYIDIFVEDTLDYVYITSEPFLLEAYPIDDPEYEAEGRTTALVDGVSVPIEFRIWPYDLHYSILFDGDVIEDFIASGDIDVLKLIPVNPDPGPGPGGDSEEGGFFMGVLNSILEVFSGIGTWIVDQVEAMIPMFYVAGESGAAGELTFLGVLSVAALGVSIVFLVIRVIQNFLHFRG